MATTFYTPLNNATSKLAANHQVGNTQLTLLSGTGPRFGNPSPSAPIRVTVQGPDPSTVTIFACTARSGDTLSGLSVIEGTTDRAYAVGSAVEMRATAGTFGDIHGAVNQLEDDLADISLTPGPQGSTGVVSAPSPLAYDAVSKTVSFVGPIAVSQVSGLQSTLDSKAGAATVNAHITNTSNPHGVTASQVGLGNVNNTADTDKPVSSATQTALNSKAPLNSPAFTGTPTAPTATTGDNTTKLATTAFVTTALAGVSGAVSSVAGKTGDVTLAIADVGNLQNTLDGKASQANLASHVSNVSNPHGVTKTQVGLGNVDNTSDLSKPVSTATQTALNGKAPSSGASSITTLGTITVGTWQANVIAPAYIGTGTPGAGKYVDGGTGAWTPLPTGAGGSTPPAGSNGNIQFNNNGALGGGNDITRVGTGSINLNSEFGGRTITNENNGSGIILAANSGVGYGTLRVVANEGGWSDNVKTAYFQIDAVNGGTRYRNCSFLSGTYGDDKPFNRLQFVSLGTTFYSNGSGNQGYNETPPPISTLEAVSTIPGRTVFGMVADTNQNVDIMHVRKGGSILAGVDSNGFFRTALTSGMPSVTTALGSMAFDPAANKLWIYGNSGWASYSKD